MSIFSKFFRKKRTNTSDDEQSASKASAREIIPESSEFNINAMLDDVANAVTLKSDEKGISLIFETDKDVPSKVIGDRLLLGEVLINLLDYTIALTEGGDVKLKVERLAVEKKELRLKFKIHYTDNGLNHAVITQNLNDFFQNKRASIPDSKSKELLFSREIVHKMAAVFLATSDLNQSVLSVEVILDAENLQEKRHYRLPSKAAIGLKVMIIDEEPSAANALQQKLEYFRHDVVIGPKNFFTPDFPDFSQFDMLFVSDKLFSSEMGEQILLSRSKSGLKFVLVENMLRPSKDDKEALHMADSLIFKPVNQQTVLDLLISLYGEGSEEEESETKKEEQQTASKSAEDRTQVSSEQKYGESFYDTSSAERKDEDPKVKKIHQLFVAKEGLQRTGNDIVLFDEILHDFLIMYSDSNIMIRTLLEAGELEDARKYMFDLKGVLANIGAYKVSHLASLMEQILPQGDLDNILKYIAIYEREFAETRGAIENFIIHIERDKELK